MNPDLTGQTALVTGAGRGIGRAVVEALAGRGAGVVLAARSGAQIEAVAEQVRSRGGAALAVATDVSDEASVRRLFGRVDERFGRLDVLVNNAGVGRFGPVAELDLRDLDAVLAVNVRGTFTCCREAMQRMIAAQAGTIINVSSVVGFKGYPNQAVYTASKHAVMGLTKSLAVEARSHGIRISAILPGGVDTDMVGEARPDLDRAALLAPLDVAEAVLYLLSLSDRAAVDEIYIRRRGSNPF